MANPVEHILHDSRNRTIVKHVINGTNTTESILDVSDLSYYLGAGDLVSLAAISWSVDAGTQILWDASTNVIALHLHGSGRYGGSDGMPAIPNNAGSGVTGDVLLTTDASCRGYIVCVYHKVVTAAGVGWTGAA